METEGKHDTRKKEKAPRGVFRLPSGEWAIRFFCGLGHKHVETTPHAGFACVRNPDGVPEQSVRRHAKRPSAKQRSG